MGNMMMKTIANRYARRSLPLLMCFSLAGCLSGSEEESNASFSNIPPSGGNGAPTISGNPATAVVVGNQYSFTPQASDPDGDSLTFSIENLPQWASFNTSTGAVTGTADAGTEGRYSNIVISVSDGSSTASLPGFTIDVTQSALGSATLSWSPPSENTDGSALVDLAGYKLYFGTEPGTYPNQVTVDNPGLTTYVVDNLVPDTYYFVSTAFNSDGLESSYSNEAVAMVVQ